MHRKLIRPLFPWLILLPLLILLLYSLTASLRAPISPSPRPKKISASLTCDLFKGQWNRDPNRRPIYDETCPFHRNAWNCLRNQRDNMGSINSWKWVPQTCDLPQIDPFRFLDLMRNRNIGFVGDSLNENFVTSFLCSLRVADLGAKKWKRKGAWKGAYFPNFNVTVAYHRAVLLAKYKWQPKYSASGDQSQSEGVYRVDVDIPADDWANITNFYDVLVFNTGHWWGYDKFPKETPLVFYRAGRPILPALEMLDGLKLVLKHMVSHIQKEIPRKTIKFWRLQSPRHFYGGEWNQNGSCLFNEPLQESQLDIWFDPSNNGVNREARTINRLINEAVRDTGIEILDLTHMSEFRADAHPAIWLGRKDAVAVWGQDCMHWCLPGVPDTWVDILSELISHHSKMG
ncbi:protein trichome birefringence-like 12 isoform X1 [Cucurbita moschata]|uniref:Protein trichome birefringence-like 12 isoform X1 n=1 Tax=Cucurbita moschata TaxID=3662 RepID=A0A6J1GL83_CUCMO|nr:protein trichome birefringence-like 12 isoform X1 [Cucurbita moschata]XP_022952246.1 protein trichome birefringence-like 12 isoform X1 [Cucurbita moschata]